MSAAARMIIDSVGDLRRRIADVGVDSPDYSGLSAEYSHLGLAPGSAILLFAPNSAEFIFHWIAVIANGYVPCAVAPSTKSVIVNALCETLKISAIVGLRLDPTLYNTQCAMKVGRFDAIIVDRPQPSYDPFDILILTTGTSGTQTACVHTVDSLACNAGMTNRKLGISSADRQLVVLPMYHSYGLVTQTIGSIISGCELKIDGPPFNAARFAQLIAREQISVCGVTPTIARDLLAREATLPPLRSMSIGGDRFAPDCVKKLLDKPFINELYITYGLSEAGPRVSVLPAHNAPESAFDTVGVPFDGVEVKIDRPDADGAGQLLVKTPSACRRKVGDNIKNQPFTEDGFLTTGDLFTSDAAGYLRYVARKADIVFVKGEKLNTHSLDLVAQSHPDVEFARTALVDGDKLVTRVWSKDGKELDLDQVKSFLRSSLRLHEVPDAIIQQHNNVFHK